jgi:hypothetical protein
MASEPDRWDPDQATGRQTAADIAERIAEYGHLDRLRHLLTTGVLPWRDILAEPQLTAQRLIEALELLRPGLVRTALDGAPLHHPDVRRALEAMPDTAIVNLICLLLPPNAADSGLTQSIVAYSARAVDRKNFQAMLIVALVRGSALDFEALAAASEGPYSPTSPLHFLPRRCSPPWRMALAAAQPTHNGPRRCCACWQTMPARRGASFPPLRTPPRR